MSRWEQIVLAVIACAILGIFERQLGHIIALLQEIRDRLHRND